MSATTLRSRNFQTQTISATAKTNKIEQQQKHPNSVGNDFRFMR